MVSYDTWVFIHTKVFCNRVKNLTRCKYLYIYIYILLVGVTSRHKIIHLFEILLVNSDKNFMISNFIKVYVILLCINKITKQNVNSINLQKTTKKANCDVDLIGFCNYYAAYLLGLYLWCKFSRPSFSVTCLNRGKFKLKTKYKKNTVRSKSCSNKFLK